MAVDMGAWPLMLLYSNPASVSARRSCLAHAVYFDGEGDRAGLIFPALMEEVQTPCVISATPQQH